MRKSVLGVSSLLSDDYMLYKLSNPENIEFYFLSTDQTKNIYLISFEIIRNKQYSQVMKNLIFTIALFSRMMSLLFTNKYIYTCVAPL